MTPSTLKAPGRSFGDWLQEIFLKRRTGRLDVSSEQEVESLFFIAGELYLSPEHPMFGAAKALSGSSESSPAKGGSGRQSPSSSAEAGVTAFRELADQILDRAGWPEIGECSFAQGAGQIRLDLVGPLPTSQLLMESAVRGCNEHQLLRRLGGERTPLQATAVGRPLPAGVELDPKEAFLLSRLEHPVAVGELLHQFELDRGQTLKRLCRLSAVDLIAPAERAEFLDRSDTPEKSLVQRFSERIEDSLKREPVAVEPDQHRELLRNLFARLGEMTHFELLAVTPQTSDEELHKAFFELGRLVHPQQAKRLGLAGREGGLAVLFERAAQAYLTLSDPDRKVRYCQEIGPFVQSGSGGTSEAQRQEELQGVARRNFEKALTLTSRQEFHSAIQLLEQAVKVDPQVEYFTLLADCQAENPQWLDRAVTSYERAIELRPDDPSLRSRMGRTLERLGQVQRARKAYEVALEMAPTLEEAQTGLQRLETARVRASEVSLFDRLRALMRRALGD